MKACLLLFIAFTASLCGLADSFALPPQGESAYADTEVSTNIALCALDDGVGRKVFDLMLSLSGTSSNGFQVAFGRDSDGNCVLDFSET